MRINLFVKRLEKINNIRIGIGHCYIDNKIKNILRKNIKKGLIKGSLSKHKPGCCTSFFNDKIHLWVLICDYHENKFVYKNLNKKSLELVQKYAKKPHPTKKQRIKHYENRMKHHGKSHFRWKKRGYIIFGLNNRNIISVFKKQNLKSTKHLNRSINPKYKKIIENLSYHFSKRQKRLAIHKLIKQYPTLNIKSTKVSKVKTLLNKFNSNINTSRSIARVASE